MRRTMIPVLLLAAVALSTGVVLPNLQTLPPGPDPIADQTSNSQSTLTECEVLRKLFRNKANWVAENNEHHTWKMLGYDTDNNQEEYNGYLNKGQGVSDDGSLKDTWLSYPRYFDQPQSFARNDFYRPYKYYDDVAGKSAYESPNPDLLYTRNNDIIIRDDNAYYVYNTYMATNDPPDYVQNRFNCLDRTKSYDSPANDENLEELERLDTNEISPLVKHIMGKRYDASDAGEKEIPDNLVFNDGEKGEVKKKLFSFWSRLQALSHKGRQVPTRRHTFVYYGPDGDGTRDSMLTAETRASHLRPPGQPLRWG